jgi:CcmD family protein
MNYLFSAFAVVWIVLFLFLMRIFQKQKQLTKELDAVRQELEQRRSR